MINYILNILTIIILSIGIFIIYIVHFDIEIKKINENTEHFENNDKLEKLKENISVAEILSDKCELEEKPHEICSNYISCCVKYTNNYVCQHPLIKQCSDEMEKCIKNPETMKLYPVELRKEKCINQLKDCCNPYNKINYDSNKFIKKNDIYQKENVIGNIIAFDEKGSKECGKLCQTDSNCVAYSIDENKCQFYDKINPVKPIFGLKNNIPKSYPPESYKGYFEKIMK